MTIHGTPGRSPGAIERRRRVWRHLVAVVVVVGVITLLAIGRPMGTIVVVAAGYLTRYRLRGMIMAAHSGAMGERLVAKTLRLSRPDVLIFDLDLRRQRSDIDVVVLGPGIATVEVKAARGRVRAMTDGRVRVGRAWLPGRPVAQAARHAASVGRYTTHHVEAVLCITAMRGRPRYVEYGRTEVLLTNVRHLRRVLRRVPRLISPRQAHLFGRVLRSGNNPSYTATPSVH